MKIQLKATRAIYINLTPKENNESRDDFSFDYEIDFPKESDSFLVAIKAIFKQTDYDLEVVYLAEFSTDSDLDENFKKSKFPYVNAPAIAYPFFRAFIANILLNSGLKPIFLPSVNFENLYKKKSNQQEKTMPKSKNPKKGASENMNHNVR